jgi:hypothetical protein
MRFRYEGERTEDPILGLLTPGMEGDGPDDVVALKIKAGLLAPMRRRRLPATPSDTTPPAAGETDSAPADVVEEE